MSWDSSAPKVGEQAADLDLLDESGRPVLLSSLVRQGPLLALVFRDPDDEASLRLLRGYRDATMALRRVGVSICAISHAGPSTLAFMRTERGLAFPLLADADGTALSRWDMLDQTGLLLLGKDLVVKQRALGERALAEAMVSFLRRSGQRRAGWRDKLAHALHSIAHALRPRHVAR